MPKRNGNQSVSQVAGVLINVKKTKHKRENPKPGSQPQGPGFLERFSQ